VKPLGPILLRADANTRMGTGHLMRSIALAQALRAAGGEPHFLSASLSPALADRLSEEEFDSIELAAEPGSMEDACEVVAIAGRIGASWIVIDGYHFSGDYQRALKGSGFLLLAIDDHAHAGSYRADIVLNQNLHAVPSLYASSDRSTKLLLGTRYALLREEFRNGSDGRICPDRARHLLVTLGGSDPGNVTATILQGLDRVASDGGEIVVAVGSGNPHLESLRELASRSSWSVSILHDVRDMAALMRRSDLAIAASGSTTWELAAMGVPSLVVPIAGNQIEVARSLQEKGAAISLGAAEELTIEGIAEAVAGIIPDRARRIELSSRARDLVDGNGAERVVDEMMQMERKKDDTRLAIRPADRNDSRLIWEWANEPAVRAVSFSSASIPWEDHQRWIARKLDDPCCRLYIGMNSDGEPVGQVRFDIEDALATLSVSLDARFRGRGYGAVLIREASRELFLTTDVEAIEAFVKPSNDSSLKVFPKAGFSAVGEYAVQGEPAVRFIIKRGEA
jgi:UDP-2,4-diacetamido-2,4,6-trideoxy-beta-L-altropyranose hydrolase